ncbi:unnamed protein product [Paramecium sonneborni]|uniref:Transmembrane protein n=1 Tax=Paramecium sonneborni TaxID=65129 RepID=A0A8S1LKG8_9CILI|nr:unnamed protein product [Paramecium sonneborni]
METILQKEWIKTMGRQQGSLRGTHIFHYHRSFRNLFNDQFIIYPIQRQYEYFTQKSKLNLLIIYQYYMKVYFQIIVDLLFGNLLYLISIQKGFHKK